MVRSQNFHREFQRFLPPWLGVGDLEENIPLQPVPHIAGGRLEASAAGIAGHQHLLEGEVDAAQHGVNQLHVGQFRKHPGEQFPSDGGNLVLTPSERPAQVVVIQQSAAVHGNGRVVDVDRQIQFVDVPEHIPEHGVVQIVVAVVGGHLNPGHAQFMDAPVKFPQTGGVAEGRNRRQRFQPSAALLGVLRGGVVERPAQFQRQPLLTPRQFHHRLVDSSGVHVGELLFQLIVRGEVVQVFAAKGLFNADSGVARVVDVGKRVYVVLTGDAPYKGVQYALVCKQLVGEPVHIGVNGHGKFLLVLIPNGWKRVALLPSLCYDWGVTYEITA